MQELVSSFPPHFPAAVFIVLHISPDSPSILPQILSRAGALPAKHAEDGEPVRSGQIFVAPPDRQMTIQDGHVRVRRGPRENRHRPAVDPLFRTAARSYDSRVIGIILSGHLDDGAAGLYVVRTLGGIGIVQDPTTAGASQMPQSALQYGGADYVLRKSDIGPQVVELVTNCRRSTMNVRSSERTRPKDETEENLEVSRPSEGNGTPSAFSCPECGGVLWELHDGELVRFRCRVGHSYTMSVLAEEQREAAENALWAAMRSLEEKAALAIRIAESTHDLRLSERMREQANAHRHHAETIRNMLLANGTNAKPPKREQGKEVFEESKVLP